jgi:hypothetical protein
VRGEEGEQEKEEKWKGREGKKKRRVVTKGEGEYQIKNVTQQFFLFTLQEVNFADTGRNCPRLIDVYFTNK